MTAANPTLQPKPKRRNRKSKSNAQIAWDIPEQITTESVVKADEDLSIPAEVVELVTKPEVIETSNEMPHKELVDNFVSKTFEQIVDQTKQKPTNHVMEKSKDITPLLKSMNKDLLLKTAMSNEKSYSKKLKRLQTENNLVWIGIAVVFLWGLIF
jgi:uncharacterized Fe-S center protein